MNENKKENEAIIELFVTEKERLLFETAANLSQVSMDDFIISSALERAYEVIREHEAKDFQNIIDDHSIQEKQKDRRL